MKDFRRATEMKIWMPMQNKIEDRRKQRKMILKILRKTPSFLGGNVKMKMKNLKLKKILKLSLLLILFQPMPAR